MQALSFVWLEITGKCQLVCGHCYAGSGPTGTHGAMNKADWCRVIDEAAALGVSMVQFIGGEPTLHPDLPDMVDHALVAGMEVEVFSNLVHVTAPLWQVFSHPGVSLATSYYSDDPGEHESITGRAGSHARTRANIAEAIRRSIPLRTGVIDLRDNQRVDGALGQLRSLGITEVGTDRLRQIGRGQRDAAQSVDQLCGKCASGVLAVSPDGAVWPCVFSRWLPVGNVRTDSLSSILTGPVVADVRSMLSDHFARQQDQSLVGVTTACGPDNCQPRCNPTCQPNCQPYCQPMCGPSCMPKRDCEPSRCGPKGNCWPKYGCEPSGSPKRKK